MTDPLRSPCDGCSTEPSRRDFLRGMAGLAIVLMSGQKAPGSAVVMYPLPGTDGAVVDHDNDVILVRYQGACYAFALSCPHQNTALRWLAADGRFQCPKHKSKYSPDGRYVSGRATRNMDRLPIRRDGARLLVDAERVYESDKDAAGWAGAQVKV